jgi:hypothetical protein
MPKYVRGVLNCTRYGEFKDFCPIGYSGQRSTEFYTIGLDVRDSGWASDDKIVHIGSINGSFNMVYKAYLPSGLNYTYITVVIRDGYIYNIGGGVDYSTGNYLRSNLLCTRND